MNKVNTFIDENNLGDIKPFVKWVGGKRQLIPELTKYIPENFGTYYEPFIGGGALFLHLLPNKAVINDFNKELVLTWKTVKDDPNNLLRELKSHKDNNSKEFYMDIRSMDRDGRVEKLTDTERAARFIYMIKTGFNGMWRINRKGQNNIPYGNQKNPLINDEKTIKAVSEYLNSSDVRILNEDFEESVKDIQTGDFVYFDPPYIPLSATSSFTSYSSEFGLQEQERLRNLVESLNERGVYVTLSNSDTELVHELYGHIEGIDIHKVIAKRSVGASSKSRGTVGEVVITNVV